MTAEEKAGEPIESELHDHGPVGIQQSLTLQNVLAEIRRLRG